MTSATALTVSFDTNVLIYAYDLREVKRQPLALRALDKIMARGTGILPAQVLGEFLSVAQLVAVTQPEVAVLRQPPRSDWVFRPEVSLGAAFRSHAPPVLL